MPPADEKSHFRGIAHTPKLGGRRNRRRRPSKVVNDVDPADQTIACTTARDPLQRQATPWSRTWPSTLSSSSSDVST